MTRRELLALLAAASARPAARAAEAGFDRIDTHLHMHRKSAAMLESMEKSGWRGLIICDSREIGDQPSILQEMIRGTIELHRQSDGRLAWATTFDARGFESPGFAARAIAGLREGFQQGAIAVKIWKNVGMGIRSKAGDYLLPDNPALFPIYESIQESGKTLIAHLAEPDAAWLPLDSSAPDIGYYKSHPEWSMYQRTGAPSKDTILAARDRVLARYPRLRVIGCHLGSNEDDLDQLTKRLEAYPNFAVDLASRVRNLVRGDRQKVRQFLDKFQDRIIYATDFTLSQSDDAKAAQSLERTHEQDWQFFAEESYEGRVGKVAGLAIPKPMLRKIFHDNAVRWLPGIVPGGAA
jgi:predicted TIM-barrel fold metal-dependent hydrolase